jgi:hypothetical protein
VNATSIDCGLTWYQACWHKDIVDRCRISFTAEIAKHGYREGDIDFFEVPAGLPFVPMSSFSSSWDVREVAPRCDRNLRDKPSTSQPGAPATDNQHYRGPAAKAPDVRYADPMPRRLHYRSSSAGLGAGRRRCQDIVTRENACPN